MWPGHMMLGVSFLSYDSSTLRQLMCSTTSAAPAPPRTRPIQLNKIYILFVPVTTILPESLWGPNCGSQPGVGDRTGDWKIYIGPVKVTSLTPISCPLILLYKFNGFIFKINSILYPIIESIPMSAPLGGSLFMLGWIAREGRQRQERE